MKCSIPILAASLLLHSLAWAAPNPRLVLPEFPGLADKASESVSITLDPSMLAMAARFLDGGDPRDAAAKEIVKGLQGIYVRSFTFNEDFAYQPADLEAVRRQLAAPGWSRLVQTRSRKNRADVEVYIMTQDNRAVGLALIASEPRQFTLVNIIGSIDLQKLQQLEGQFGIPKLDAEPAQPGPK